MIKKLCYININIIINNNYSDEDYDHDPLWHFQLLDGPWLTINSLPLTNNTLMSLSSEMGSKEGLPSFSWNVNRLGGLHCLEISIMDMINLWPNLGSLWMSSVKNMSGIFINFEWNVIVLVKIENHCYWISNKIFASIGEQFNVYRHYFEGVTNYIMGWQEESKTTCNYCHLCCGKFLLVNHVCSGWQHFIHNQYDYPWKIVIMVIQRNDLYHTFNLE